MNRIKKIKSKKTTSKNITAKIDMQNRPSWYVQYSWSPVPDFVDYFVGRELEFMGFWHEMTKLVGHGGGKKSNYAFIGQRKLGKTAYLKRCYNIAFWEQDEVVPFYYSFAQNDGYSENIVQLQELKEEMPIRFLKQFFAFCTKDKLFLELQTVNSILDYVKKIKFPKLERILVCIHDCLGKINRFEGTFMLQHIWQLTQELSLFMGKKCFLIIDEAQEMDISLYDGKERRRCKASISDIIQKDDSVVFVSGSNVSMLVNNFLDHSFANRFKKKKFTPLQSHHAKQLIAKRCSNGYKSLSNDLLELVGGNPYYIDEILNFNMNYCELHGQGKDFSCKMGLQQAYDFEVLNPEGYIYDFWQVHLRKNKDDLNQDPKGKKGLALQLLYKVASNTNNEFTYVELMKEFDVDEETLVSKIEPLEHANLIEPMGVSRLAHAFPDKILPVIINKIYHQLIIAGPSKKVAQQAIKDYNSVIANSIV